MDHLPPQDQIETARAYEDLFVPALFGQWAPLVADAAVIQTDMRVLDVGCGTGVLAREAASRTGADGNVVGLDPNPGMIAWAGRLARGIDWQEGNAENLPFPDGAFDAVVSQFSLMFFSDQIQAIREMRRVLAPGGRLVAAVWDSLDRNPGYLDEVKLLERTAGSVAAEALRAPFALGEADELDRLFSAAGAPGTRVTTHGGTALFPSIRTMVEADLRGWLPVMGVELSEDRITEVLIEADRTLAPYQAADGSVSFPLSVHLVTASQE